MDQDKSDRISSKCVQGGGLCNELGNLQTGSRRGEISGLGIDNFSRYAVTRALLSKRRTRVKDICGLLTASASKNRLFLVKNSYRLLLHRPYHEIEFVFGRPYKVWFKWPSSPRVSSAYAHFLQVKVHISSSE